MLVEACTYDNRKLLLVGCHIVFLVYHVLESLDPFLFSLK